jgi:hypothetical protein
MAGNPKKKGTGRTSAPAPKKAPAANTETIGPRLYGFDPQRNLFNDHDDKGNILNFPKDIKEVPNGIDTTTEFHVNYLKNQFRDLARPNLFKVMITPPQPLQTEWNANKGLVTLTKSASFPQISVKEWVYERAGQKLYIPTNEIEYGECTLTFHNDSQFALRTMFMRWQRLAIYNWNHYTGSIPLLALDGSIVIYQYNNALEPIFAVKLNNCWPQTVSAIELSHETENTAEEFTVDFKFTKQEIFKNITENLNE